MSISLSEIRAFNAVVEHGNVTRAASALSVSQPAVTAQIRKLESRSGHYLLERTPNGFVLTNQGKRLYQISRQYTDLGNALDDVLSGDTQTPLASIKIATASALIFMPLLAEFRRQYPDTCIDIHSTTSAECQTLLLNREVDVALFPLRDKAPALSHFAFYQHKLKAIVPKGSPLSELKDVSIKALALHPLIFSAHTCYTQFCLDDLLLSQGIKATSQIRLDQRHEICEAVIQGLGVGFAFEGDIRADERYQLLNIIEADEPAVEHVVWLKKRSIMPAVQEFVQLALEQIAIKKD
ncbi:Transcriptional Regulator, LysR family protein [Marinomonas sp. MED121]|uniref:LysR family transcriptional regulator n=1 Tax=Marinomonas sp. MED121 TaxID=314277 RepID=UPI0000690F7F|nr:LysR family transcriptional regulator [Marinomonas sp. MED121]EAQ67185.1 Transcriptional Regulator, LysR family protein [Marinomonas sp. MED121]